MNTDYARMRVDTKGFKKGEEVFIVERGVRNMVVASDSNTQVVRLEDLEPIPNEVVLPNKFFKLLAAIDKYSYMDHRKDQVVVRMEDVIDVLQDFSQEEKHEPGTNPLFSVPKGFKELSGDEVSRAGLRIDHDRDRLSRL